MTRVFIIICIFVGVFYGATLRNGFIHDDHGQVETNINIQSLMSLPKVFTSCIWESAVGNCKETYYYRPLQSLSYLVTYQFSSRPWVFHLVNLIYFAIVVWLVFVLIRILTKDTRLALLAAGIFLIHPLNTETVNWIATVPELLYVLCILLSTISFIYFRRTGRSKYLWWCCISYALGILAKEPAVFLLFVFLTLDFIYFKKKINNFFNWKTLAPYVLSLGSFIAYFVLRLNVLGGLGADPYYHLTILQRMYIFIDLFGSYMRKLVYPYPLNLFYTFHPSYDIFRPDFIAAIAILITFIGFLMVAIKKGWKIVSFSLVWYVVFLAPSLIFVNSIGENLFAERHVFASTIGFSLLIALLLRKWKKIGFFVFFVLAVCSFVVINPRNALWRSDETIYADTLKKSPDADLIRYNLAYLYEQSGYADKAKVQYATIIQRNTWRGMDKVYNNLGDIARKEGNFPLARQYFQQSLAINPLHVEAYNNLGAMAFEQGDLLTALTFLCQANRINPVFQPANNNFDRLVNTIGGMDEKTFGVFYRSLLTNGTFHQASDSAALTLQQKDCAATDGCLFTFATHKPASAFIFSFLVAGVTDSGQIVRPRRMGIRQATGDMVLDLDKKWENTSLRFSFPTCDKTYYQVIVGTR